MDQTEQQPGKARRRRDVIMNQGPLPDVGLVEIVDEIFLPLLRG
jgi:hypothetical protein